MSDSDEWEREQMLRGTQSRRVKSQATKISEKPSDVIDTASIKKHVHEDIDKVEADIESIKKSIGSTKLDIVRSEKKLEAIRKRVVSLESSNNLFQELGALAEEDILDFIGKHRSTITKLPHDQREMIDLLAKKLGEESQNPMDVDQ